MDIRRITEIGVAVRDLAQASELLVQLFNADVGDIVEVERYSMRFRMCRIGKVDFELMEPIGNDGVIASFLDKRGEGLHHIAFAVDDIHSTRGALGAKGVKFVEGAPMRERMGMVDYAGRKFCDEIQFTFTNPGSILGILFEFIQYPEGYQTP